jgi:hypothetical protein
LAARAIPTEVQQHFFGGQDESQPQEGKMSQPEADPIANSLLQALAHAELLLLRLSVQLELARASHLRARMSSPAITLWRAGTVSYVSETFTATSSSMDTQGISL